MVSRIGSTPRIAASTPVSQPVRVLSFSSEQKFSGSGSSFSISGTSKARELVIIKMGLKTWNINIPAKSTPAQAAKAFEKQLPKTFTMKMTWAADHIGGPVGFQLYQKGTKPIVEALPAPRGSTDFSRVTESWGRTDRRGVVSSPPIWYMQWKIAGKAPPPTLNGVFRAGEALIFVVKNGKVNSSFSGMIKDENGKALIVSGGKITGAQG